MISSSTAAAAATMPMSLGLLSFAVIMTMGIPPAYGLRFPAWKICIPPVDGLEHEEGEIV
jgi:hypothetical protein